MRLQRVFELPLRAGDLVCGKRPGKFAARQQHAQTRPQDHHYNVGLMRWSDLLLKGMGGHKRLAFPQHRLNVKMVRKFAIQPLDHAFANQTLRSNVGWRRDEYTE